MWVGGQCHILAALAWVRGPLAIVQEAGWDLASVWTDAENLAPTGIRSLQPSIPTSRNKTIRHSEIQPQFSNPPPPQKSHVCVSPLQNLWKPKQRDAMQRSSKTLRRKAWLRVVLGRYDSPGCRSMAYYQQYAPN
jgi:hypothetical protein